MRIPKNVLLFSEREKKAVLKRFMREFFPYGEFRKAGIFTEAMRDDYEAQAKRVCEWFGFESVYEYGGFTYTMSSIYE